MLANIPWWFFDSSDMVFLFWFVNNVVAIFIFNVLRLEVIVLFVYIDGIVDHHWLNFFS
jgi:hypothetical protein